MTETELCCDLPVCTRCNSWANGLSTSVPHTLGIRVSSKRYNLSGDSTEQPSASQMCHSVRCPAWPTQSGWWTWTMLCVSGAVFEMCTSLVIGHNPNWNKQSSRQPLKKTIRAWLCRNKLLASRFLTSVGCDSSQHDLNILFDPLTLKQCSQTALRAPARLKTPAAEQLTTSHEWWLLGHMRTALQRLG